MLSTVPLTTTSVTVGAGSGTNGGRLGGGGRAGGGLGGAGGGVGAWPGGWGGALGGGGDGLGGGGANGDGASLDCSERRRAVVGRSSRHRVVVETVGRAVGRRSSRRRDCTSELGLYSSSYEHAIFISGFASGTGTTLFCWVSRNTLLIWPARFLVKSGSSALPFSPAASSSTIPLEIPTMRSPGASGDGFCGGVAGGNGISGGDGGGGVGGSLRRDSSRPMRNTFVR